MKTQHIKRLGLLMIAVLLAILPAVGSGAESSWRTTGPTDTMSVPPPCTPSCYGWYSSFANVALLPSSPTFDQTETSIAINLNMTWPFLAGANTASGPTNGRTTFREGTYWYLADSSRWTGNNNSPPTAVIGSDPTVGIANGKYWYSYLDYDGSQLHVTVARGVTPGEWPSRWTVPATTSPDKPHMAVEDGLGGPYVAYVEYGPDPGVAKWINFSKYDSTSNQMTPPITLVSAPLGNARLFHGPNVAIGPHGDVYVAWAIFDSGQGIPSHQNIQSETGIGFARSTDGGATFTLTQDSIPGLGVRGIFGPLKPSTINVNSFPSMAVDRSGYANAGSIYIVWAGRSNDGTPDIYLTTSRNGGASWSSPIRVNHNGAGTDQWMPWVTVDPFGYVHVVYYDSRLSPENDYSAVYMSSSYDGGQSFQDTLVSDQICIPCRVPGTPGDSFYGYYMGDYIGIASVRGYAYPCWNDARTGVQQAYTAAVSTRSTPPGGGGGGCPYVYTWDGREYRQENTILGQCESRGDGSSVTDYLRLQQPLVADAGEYKLQVREFEQEKSYLDALELLVVDYPTDARMGVAPDGEVFLYDQEYRPIAAYDHTGTDVLGLILDEDGRTYSSQDAGALYIEFQVWRPGLPGVLYDPTPPGEQLMGPPPPQKRGNPGTGVLVQVEDRDGNWHAVDVQPPRGNPENALWLLNKAAGYELGTRFRVRLSWNGQFEADQLVYYSLRSEEPGVVHVRPTAATHSLKGETSQLLVEADEGSTTLEPGEVLNLTFPTPELANPPSGRTRGFVLKSTGYYETATSTLARDAVLSQNQPNPFNSGTVISFTLEQRETARLEVYNVLGQHLVTLVDETLGAGVHTASWDGRDEHGTDVPTGVYLYGLTHGAKQETRKMTLLR